MSNIWFHVIFTICFVMLSQVLFSSLFFTLNLFDHIVWKQTAMKLQKEEKKMKLWILFINESTYHYLYHRIYHYLFQHTQETFLLSLMTSFFLSFFFSILSTKEGIWPFIRVLGWCFVVQSLWEILPTQKK